MYAAQCESVALSPKVAHSIAAKRKMVGMDPVQELLLF